MKNIDKRVYPGSTIGILGGGQLGRMIGLAARAMGFRLITLDPTEEAPCGQVADRQFVAGYDDVKAAKLMAERADVITYEFENVDSRVAQILEEESDVPQGSQLLYTTQHRLREKKAIEQAGVPVAPYHEITDLQSLHDAVETFGFPAVLKTATGGYDGKGQFVLKKAEDVEAAFDELTKHRTELVLEKFIHFDKEISVIAARNRAGQIETFPPAENIHVENILHLSIAPARISREIDEKARQLAEQIAESMNVIGLIAVEMFLTKDGQLYVNELAPRPHNSGHYTMDACRTSQFEQHVRAICNWPLGKTDLLTPVVMVNILGEHVEPLYDWLMTNSNEKQLDMKVHMYGKKEVKHKRKMGHVNLLTDDVDNALEWVKNSPIWQNIYS